MMLTLTLAAGLLAAPEPQAEQPKGWVVEVRGFTKHPQAKPEGWIIEVRGFIKHPKQAETPNGLIIEPVEAQYHGDLSAFFKQLKVQGRGEAVESFYVDDLPAFFERLKRR
jgi:hypothetical protein